MVYEKDREDFGQTRKGAVNRLPGILVDVWIYNYLYVRGSGIGGPEATTVCLESLLREDIWMR